MPIHTRDKLAETIVYDEHGLVRFPAFVHLPASARPNGNRLVHANDAYIVKFVTLCCRTRKAALRTFRAQIASRCRIDDKDILALTVDHGGKRILIETDDDWEEWTAALFSPLKRSASTSIHGSDSVELKMNPLDIHVLLAAPLADARPAPAAMPTSDSRSTGPASADSTSAPVSNQDAFEQVPREMEQERVQREQREQERLYRRLQEQQQREQQRQQEQQQRRRERQQEDVQRRQQRQQEQQHRQYLAAAFQPPALPQLHSLGSTIASNVTQSVLQALQPLSRELPPLVSSMLSDLSAQIGNLPINQPSNDAPVPAPTADLGLGSVAHQTSQAASAAGSSVPSRADVPNQSTESQQRQSLLEGMLDELERVRSAQTSTPGSQSQRDLEAAPRGSDQASMNTALTQAFAEMLAQQRNALEQPAADTREDDEESLTIISTPSESPRRSRSRTRSRSPSRRALLSGASLTILAVFTLLLGLVTPALATPTTSLFFNSLNPRDLGVSNSRQLHLCKCTCFQTNSTLVPLYAPLDPAKPCVTCTRQFCLDQGLDICKGAELPHTDHDTGTGLEGDVWAKCFERDSAKDQGIITLYVLVVVGLVAWAGLRGRVGGWVQEYQTMRPGALASAVRNAPWRRSSR